MREKMAYSGTAEYVSAHYFGIDRFNCADCVGREHSSAFAAQRGVCIFDSSINQCPSDLYFGQQGTTLQIKLGHYYFYSSRQWLFALLSLGQ